MIVNGNQVSVKINPFARLLDVLREDLHLTGTKEGCGVGECGACTVIVDGETVNTCLTLAASMEGKCITTIEGIAANDQLHPIQQAFIDDQWENTAVETVVEETPDDETEDEEESEEEAEEEAAAGLGALFG